MWVTSLGTNIAMRDAQTHYLNSPNTTWSTGGITKHLWTNSRPHETNFKTHAKRCARNAALTHMSAKPNCERDGQTQAQASTCRILQRRVVGPVAQDGL